MDDFEKKVAEVVSNKLNDGTVEKLIEEKLEDAVKSALNDIFSWSGDGKKMLEEKLNEVMVPVIEKHDFNKYIVKLDTVLTEIVNQTSLADNKKILENFKGLMKEPDKTEIKLSEIFEHYCKHVARDVDTDELEACCDDGEPYYEWVTAKMEVEQEEKGYFTSNYDYCNVTFTCDEDADLNYRIKLYKHSSDDKWDILLSSIDSIEIRSLRYLSDFEVLVHSLKRSYSKIIIDTTYECDDNIVPEEKPEWSLD